MTKNQIAKKLEVERKKLSEFRDRLRDLEFEISTQIDDIDEAMESLAYAIEALSRKV